jgi:hypothetical protein
MQACGLRNERCLRFREMGAFAARRHCNHPVNARVPDFEHPTLAPSAVHGFSHRSTQGCPQFVWTKAGHQGIEG